MHLYLITRGVQHQVNIWKTFMQSQFFPFKRTALDTGKEENIGVQGALRPVQFWEYVFPEGSLNEVLANMQIFAGSDLNPPHLNKYAKLMRKFLKLKEVPKLDKEEAAKFPFRPMHTFGVAVHPIGLKEDITRDWTDFNYHQEGL